MAEHERRSTTPSRKRSKWDDDDEQPSEQQPPPPKRRAKIAETQKQAAHLLTPGYSIYVPPRTHHYPIIPSRSVFCYERLNQIEEGSYGIVYRAKDKQTGDIVALKKLKLDEEKNGFPITALREINALMTCRHENVVGIREVVVGDTLTQYVQPAPRLKKDLQHIFKSIRRHGLH